MARTKLKLKSIASGTIPGRIKIANENITAGSVDSDAMGAGAISPAKLSDFAQSLTNRNVIINGAMNVAQRQVSVTGLGASSGYFTVDRFKMVCNNTAGRFTMTQTADGPSGFANCLKLDCTTADTSIASNEEFGILYRMEGQDLQHFKKGTSGAYKTTLSFYVKGNAAATYVAELMDSDNSSRHIGATFNVTTDWTRVEITFPGDTTGTLDDDSNASLDLQFFLHAGSNNTSGTLQTSWGSLVQANRAVGISSFFDSTDRTFFITGIQLEVGETATEFEHETFNATRYKCLRYYETNYEDGYYPADGVTYSNTYSTFPGNCYHQTGGGRYIMTSHRFLVQKRTSPSMTLYRVAGLGSGSTANRWSWFNYSAGWELTDDSTEVGEISSQHHGALVRDTEANVNEALVVAGGWQADAEL